MAYLMSHPGKEHHVSRLVDVAQTVNPAADHRRTSYLMRQARREVPAVKAPRVGYYRYVPTFTGQSGGLIHPNSPDAGPFAADPVSRLARDPEFP